ncbi:hypothetical protein HYV21_01955 [Candidatus Microgenomates bacterium]|nr:hypothetical protein [Candidatus Microgenomates bacterium]
MAEDTPEQEQQQEPSKSSLTTQPISRRTAIKIGVGAIATLLAGGKDTPRQAKVETALEKGINALGVRIENSQLSASGDKNEWTKATLREFLESTKRAVVNLEVLATQPETEKIREIVRQKFSNPDIDPDNQVFFLRDKKILEAALGKLEQLPFETEEQAILQAKLKKILDTSTYPITFRELRSSSSERSLTPRNIVSNYERLGSKKSGTIEVSTGIENESETSKERLRQVNEEVTRRLAALPLTDLSLSIVIWDTWKDAEPLRGKFNYEPWSDKTPSIEYHFKGKPAEAPFGLERETLFILHEAAHALDIESNPTIMQFLTPPQITHLVYLRELATLESFSPDIESLLAIKQLRGEKIWPVSGTIGKDRDSHFDWRSWFLSKSKEEPIKPEELNLLVRAYPESGWLGFYPLSEKWLEDFQLRLRFGIFGGYSTGFLNSWEEFINSQSNMLNNLARTDPILRHGLQLLTTRINSLDTEDFREKSAVAWQSSFAKALQAVLAEDLMKAGTSKEAFKPEFYTHLLKEFQIDYRGAEREGLADGIAFLLFLESERGQNPNELRSPYWNYYQELRKLIKEKPRIVTVE